jgi:uncharacterized membrane protein YeaQ/YmgE (transglycosylase-associated protein family)
MHLSNENLLVIILVGLIADWLAGQVIRGSGFGLVGDLIVRLLGTLVGVGLPRSLNPSRTTREYNRPQGHRCAAGKP